MNLPPTGLLLSVGAAEFFLGLDAKTPIIGVGCFAARIFGVGCLIALGHLHGHPKVQARVFLKNDAQSRLEWDPVSRYAVDGNIGALETSGKRFHPDSPLRG